MDHESLNFEIINLRKYVTFLELKIENLQKEAAIFRLELEKIKEEIGVEKHKSFLDMFFKEQ